MKGITITDREDNNVDLCFDLKDVLSVQESAVEGSWWRISGLECFGEGSEEMYRLEEGRELVKGNRLLTLSNSISQTIEGYFEGYMESARAPWICIRAVDGGAFDVECCDDAVLDSYRRAFRFVSNFP